MKKLQEVVKPFISLILGGLIILYYLNWLQFDGARLAIGLFALLMGIYYLFSGIIPVMAKDKLNASLNKVFDLVSVLVLPLFLAMYNALIMIFYGRNIGPNGWIISIYSLVVSLGFIIFYLLNEFGKSKNTGKYVQLLSMGFALVLLLLILFNDAGNSILLGQLDIIQVVIYSLYLGIMFGSINVEKETVKNEVEIKNE